MRNRGSHVTPLITTIAVGLMLQHAVVKLFGAEPVAFPAPFASAFVPAALATLAGGPPTETSLRSFSSRLAPMPLTFFRSSTDLKGPFALR